MLNHPVLVRHHPDLFLAQGDTLGRGRPCMIFPGLPLLQANYTPMGGHVRRLFLGTAAGTEVRDLKTVFSCTATYYVVRSPGDTLVATACTRKEAIVIARDPLAGSDPRILLADAYRGQDGVAYLETPILNPEV